MQFTPSEISTALHVINKMLEVNSYQHGDITCHILIGNADLSEDLNGLKAKFEQMEKSGLHTIDPLV
jgi:hypothetical protein